MRSCSRLLVVLAAVIALPASVSADPMDVALARLRLEQPDGSFRADNDSWSSLMSQLGNVIAPPLLSPARTTGFRHFYLGFETSIVQIDDNADYWAVGTEGDSMAIGRNRFVDSTLNLSRLHLRKGLPFGLELGLSAGHIFNTSYWVWGGSLKISLMEGFRKGLAAFIPDVAIRASVQTLTGDGEYNLTVPSLDVIASKPFVLGRTVVLTPIVGVQFFWTAADSESVDLTPEVDEWATCNANPNLSPRPDDMWALPTPACRGDGSDFQNEVEFSRFRAFRSRIVVGFNLRYQIFQLAGSIHWDLQSPTSDADVPDGTARQFNVTVAGGVYY